MSTVVIREVAKDVWTFSCPFARFGILPVGGRSTAVKLANGDVWVLASTPLTEDTKSKLRDLGPVKYIIGPNKVHHLYLAAFKSEYPQAKVIGVEPLVAKKEKENLRLDGAYGVDPADTKYGFEEDIKACYFSGFSNSEVAFFHTHTSSLILSDLLFNLPPNEQYSKSKTSSTLPFLANILKPDTWAHKQFAWRLGIDKAAMKRDVQTVASWHAERIIPCHGDVIEKDGDKAWRAAYGAYFD